MRELECHARFEPDQAQNIIDGQLDYDECPECGDEVEHNVWPSRKKSFKGKQSLYLEASCVECDWRHKLRSFCQLEVEFSIE